MILEALCPLRVRLPDIDLHMNPGCPIELPDDQAVRLLAKLPDKVRRLERTTQIEPAASHSRPVYWETGSGQNVGPAIPEFLAQDGEPVYCERCGGGYWIRETFASFLQCGRCSPSDARVETLFVPGGTPPPEFQVQAVGSNQDIIMEPAAPNARAIYWETGTGRILGPAIPEFLAQAVDTFWIVTTFEGQVRWINAEQLRSKRDFERQIPVHEVELVRY